MYALARIQCCKYRVAPDMAMTGLRTMILPYGAGGEPGRGEIPMDLLSKQAPDAFPFACGALRTNNMQRPKPKIHVLGFGGSIRFKY